jgi:two-component system, NtrC family, response regulator AtoC
VADEHATELIAPLASSGRSLVVSLDGRRLVVDLPARGKLIVGRGVECDVVLDHSTISRKHAAIELGETVRIEDLGSANGTRLAGRLLETGDPVTLVPGVVVELGSVLATLQDAARQDALRPFESDIVVLDPVMRDVLESVRIAAASALSVLLLGETGVGKEIFARRVHELSPRKASSLIRINCAALVENLLEAELFGYERGAFTGAARAKVGLLEAASGGTLFLDEVGELPLSTQAKLLRVLESGEVTRVGGLKPSRIDVRFVSATHRDLPALVASGAFREDLFFRLDVVSIRIPPLRERPKEIVPLAQMFIAEAAAATGRAAPALATTATAALVAHPWRGNVRELRNLMQRSVLFAKGPLLEASDLRFEALGRAAGSIRPRPERAGGVDDRALERAERRKRVVDALEKALWNQSRAAKALGISRRTLHSWMMDLAIPRARTRE